MVFLSVNIHIVFIWIMTLWSLICKHEWFPTTYCCQLLPCNDHSMFHSTYQTTRCLKPGHHNI